MHLMGQKECVVCMRVAFVVRRVKSDVQFFGIFMPHADVKPNVYLCSIMLADAEKYCMKCMHTTNRIYTYCRRPVDIKNRVLYSSTNTFTIHTTLYIPSKIHFTSFFRSYYHFRWRIDRGTGEHYSILLCFKTLPAFMPFHAIICVVHITPLCCAVLDALTCDKIHLKR